MRFSEGLVHKSFEQSAIGLSVFVIYALLLPEHLVGWDPLQFALGLEHFSMEVHQPHPPGYLLHMGISAALHLLGMEAQRAVAWTSVFAVACAAAAVFALGCKMHSRAVGYFATVLFITNPIVAHEALSGECYPLEALAVTVLVWAGLHVKRDDIAAGALCGLLGVLGGVRQSIPIFYAPFVLWRVLKCGPGLPRRLALCCVFFIIGIASWVVPLLLLSGDAIELFYSQFIEGFRTSSLLLGGTFSGFISNLDVFTRVCLAAFAPCGVLVLVFIVFSRRVRDQFGGLWPVYILWMVPPLLFFILVYIIKPGHFVQLIPVLAVGISVLFSGLIPRLSVLLVTALVIIQSIAFLAPPTWWSRVAGRIAYQDILREERSMLETIEGLKHIAGTAPASLLVVTHLARFTFRQAMMYVPELRVLWLVDGTSSGMNMTGRDVCEGFRFVTTCRYGHAKWMSRELPGRMDVRIPETTRYIAWFATAGTSFARNVERNTKLEVLRTGKHGKLVVSGLPDGPFILDIGGWRLIR